MSKVVAELRKTVASNLLSSDAKVIAKHLANRKLLVRDRIDLLLDKASPFLELSQLAAFGMYKEDAGQHNLPAAGIVTGIGRVHGRECMIIANDATVKGGTYFPVTIKKHLRAQQIALENELPCVYLVDSGGANLRHQVRLFGDQFHFGRIFFNQSRMSALRIPQIAVVMGSCTAGGAYIPSMAEESVIVRSQGTVFLAGPPLVKAATGEIVTAEQLGGADLHCRKSGVTDHYANDDYEALAIARRIISRLNANDPPVRLSSPRKAPIIPPLRSSEQLLQLLEGGNHNINMKKVIECLVDGSHLDEFKAKYGQSLITGFAHIHGFSVGIIANNGVLFPEAALKGTHFIELCCQRQIPLLFLQNITGFMVGPDAEAEGIAKHGAKMVTAVSCAQVPKMTVLLGGSHGAGNFGMCGRAYDPRFLFAWPNSRLSIMGGEQAASVLSSIQKPPTPPQFDNNVDCKILEEFAQKEKETRMKQEFAKQKLLQQFEMESEPSYTSARIFDDGLIDPTETRTVLGLCLSIFQKQRSLRQKSTADAHTTFGLFRM